VIAVSAGGKKAAEGEGGKNEGSNAETWSHRANSKLDKQPRDGNKSAYNRLGEREEVKGKVAIH